MTRSEEIMNAADLYAGGRINAEGFKSGAEWADNNPKSPLISTKKETPVERVMVLVHCVKDNCYYKGSFHKDGDKPYWLVDGSNKTYRDFEEIDYWMYFPKLPED